MRGRRPREDSYPAFLAFLKYARPLTTAALVLTTAAACQGVQPAPVLAVVPPAPPEATLWDAAAAGDASALAAHRSLGADLNALHPDLGITPLVAATAAGQEAVVDWLLDHGADVNARTADGNTTLHAAAFMGNATIAARLLEADIDVSVSNDSGQTPWQTLQTDWETTRAVAVAFELAMERQKVEAGRSAIGEMLAPHLEDLGAEDIWLAVATGNADAVRIQVGAGADVNRRDANGASLLTVAAIFGHADVAAVVLDAGADVNARNPQNGATALHAAAFLGRADVVEVLLQAGADAAAMNDNGVTALSAAQLDWTTTEAIAGMLQVPAGEEASVMAGKRAVVEMLEVKLGP